MYILNGNSKEFLIVKSDSITVHKRTPKFFENSWTETTVTLPIKDMFDVVFVKPKWYKQGWITFIFADSESCTMRVNYRSSNRIESLYQILKNRIFT